MSQDSVEAAYRRKLSSNPEGELDYITVEITHQNIDRQLLVRGSSELTVTLETGEVVTFLPTPMESTAAQNSGDMDQTASFTLHDVDNILDDAMSKIDFDNDELPIFTFRLFVSSDLSYPAEGPISYQLQSISQEKGKFTAEVAVPMMNQRGTGILMTPAAIPLLRGLLTT